MTSQCYTNERNEATITFLFTIYLQSSLQWRHNECDCVSNHRRRYCLPNRLFRRRAQKYQNAASLAFVRGIHQWLVNYPHKEPVNGKCLHFMTSSCTYISIHTYETHRLHKLHTTENYYTNLMLNNFPTQMSYTKHIKTNSSKYTHKYCPALTHNSWGHIKCLSSQGDKIDKK